LPGTLLLSIVSTQPFCKLPVHDAIREWLIVCVLIQMWRTYTLHPKPCDGALHYTPDHCFSDHVITIIVQTEAFEC